MKNEAHNAAAEALRNLADFVQDAIEAEILSAEEFESNGLLDAAREALAKAEGGAS